MNDGVAATKRVENFDQGINLKARNARKEEECEYMVRMGWLVPHRRARGKKRNIVVDHGHASLVGVGLLMMDSFQSFLTYLEVKEDKETGRGHDNKAQGMNGLQLQRFFLEW